jgi:hypothetical protein
MGLKSLDKFPVHGHPLAVADRQLDRPFSEYSRKLEGLTKGAPERIIRRNRAGGPGQPRIHQGLTLWTFFEADNGPALGKS